MKFIIVTGLSGSGKSVAMDALEDMGYYCVDNLPPALITNFADLVYKSNQNIDKIALGIDIRGRKFFEALNDSLEYLDRANYKYDMVFLDCDSQTLIRRYKMTRRNHPLAVNKSLLDGIMQEIEIMEPLKLKSDMIIDTSKMKPKDLIERIKTTFFESDGDHKFQAMTISVLSFGFKYGLPLDADFVVDVRFLPNPFYVEELKPMTGDDREVREYVMNSQVSEEFKDKLFDFIDFLIPQYEKEGKQHLTLAIGCTGGRHRSVTMANFLSDHLDQKGHRTIKKHRDKHLG